MKENVLLNIFHRSLVQSNENKIKRNGADEKKGVKRLCSLRKCRCSFLSFVSLNTNHFHKFYDILIYSTLLCH